MELASNQLSAIQSKRVIGAITTGSKETVAYNKLQSLASVKATDSNEIADEIASSLTADAINLLKNVSEHTRLYSPAAFRFKLTDTARSDRQRIVLPEGYEPRTIKAAAICAERGIATPVLLGNAEEIKKTAADLGVTLGKGIEIIGN